MNFSNFPHKIVTFFKETYLEIKRVNWPSKKDLLEYTALVIFVTVIVAAILGMLDFVFTSILNKIILR